MKGKIRNLLVASAAIVSLGAIASTPAMRTMDTYLGLSDVSVEETDSVENQETGNASIIGDGFYFDEDSTSISYGPDRYEDYYFNADSDNVFRAIEHGGGFKGYYSVSKETVRDLISNEINGMLIILDECGDTASFAKMEDPYYYADGSCEFPTSANVFFAYCYHSVPNNLTFVEPVCLTVETPDADGMDFALDYFKGEESVPVTCDEEGLHANISHSKKWYFKMNFKIEYVKTTEVVSDVFVADSHHYDAPVGFRTNTDNVFLKAFLNQWVGTDTIGNFVSESDVCMYKQSVYTFKLTSGTKEFYFDVYGIPLAMVPRYDSAENLIFNPSFALVEPYAYGPLYGWTIYDTSVKNPLTGGFGASSATADQVWTKFNNAGSINKKGEKNVYSTAATFVFGEPNYFCSSTSEYVYGDTEVTDAPDSLKLKLEPNCSYVLGAQMGYLNEGEPGYIEFSVVNKVTGRTVMSSVVIPMECVSDSTRIPEYYSMCFKTDDAPGAEEYKIVVKNGVSYIHWTMVMSNIYLIKLPSKDEYVYEEEPSDTVKVDIATPNTTSSENTTTPVVTENKDGEKCYVYNPEDETKNQTVSFTVPVETVAAGNKYYVVIDLVPTDEARIRATYYSFGLKGMPHKTYTRPSTPANEETNVLGSYLYTGDKEERLVFEFTLPEDMDAVEILISTQNPAESASDCTSAIGLKQVSLTTGKETKAGNNATTAIEVANNQKQVVPTEIYTMSGVKVSSLQKGINIIRFSDGTIKKVMY